MITLDQFLYFTISIIIVSISAKIIQKVRKIGKRLILVLSPSGFYHTEYKKPIDATKLNLWGKDMLTEFKPEQVFEEKKPLWKFWRNPNKLIVVGEYQKEALGFELHNYEREIDELSEPLKETARKILKMFANWSIKEMIDFHDKIGLKSRAKTGKGESLLPIFTLIVCILTLVLLFIGFHRIGVI